VKSSVLEISVVLFIVFFPFDITAPEERCETTDVGQRLRFCTCNEGRIRVDSYVGKCSRYLGELQGFWGGKGDALKKTKVIGGTSLDEMESDLLTRIGAEVGMGGGLVPIQYTST